MARHCRLVSDMVDFAMEHIEEVKVVSIDDLESMLTDKFKRRIKTFKEGDAMAELRKRLVGSYIHQVQRCYGHYLWLPTWGQIDGECITKTADALQVIATFLPKQIKML